MKVEGGWLTVFMSRGQAQLHHMSQPVPVLKKENAGGFISEPGPKGFISVKAYPKYSTMYL